ncbi:hypothetical protein Trco_006569 [Trichoderma cornu-damae]|uniref:Uncharacterized protein n=1 Tax=Trichoderma cornu-damae TaxID=654480 RepID=A0A9P8QLR0_9HYPO|nr:hypothetical protein Trco_006569 [Trichoderma cornu-damae]
MPGDDERDEFDDVLPLRSGIFSGEREEGGRSGAESGLDEGAAGLGCGVVDDVGGFDVDGVDVDEEEAVWRRRDWFHDV